MQFKNPELLYFFFALIIPILVHLFQLKKFKIQEFTNVAFLKEISLQTRKSSQLKKWLLLACRLFLLTFLILAFAQPYFPGKNQNLASNNLVIALDNSFSMQSKGEKGILLSRAIQDILENIPKTKSFSLLTSSDSYWDIDIESSQNTIQKISYSSKSFNLKNIENRLLNRNTNKNFDLVVISDGKLSTNDSLLYNKNNYLYKLNPINTQNVAIENVILNDENSNFNELEILLKGYGIKDSLEVSLSVLENNKTASKTKVWVSNSLKKLKANLPKESVTGEVLIEDNSLTFDNTYYFTIKAQNKTKIGIYGEKSSWLEKIFPNQNTSIEPINDNTNLKDFHGIILNQPSGNLDKLGEKIQKLYNSGIQIIYIPHENTNLNTHNEFLKHFGNVKFTDINNVNATITTIHDSHPVYKNVFSKKPDNFIYPTTKLNFKISGIISPILSYSNQEIAIGGISNGISNIYIFGTSLSEKNTDLLKSPIIVPTIYNMMVSQNINQVQNYTINANEFIIIDALSTNQNPIFVKNEAENGIPLQHPIGSKIKLIFDEFPTKSGNFNIIQNDQKINQISMNYNRIESDLSLPDANLFNNFVKVNSIDEVLNLIDENRLGIELFKYFLFATLLFFILELLIQKFVK